MTRSTASPAFSVGVVILAAGRSARMGRPKLLLPWGKTSVLGHLISQWYGLAAKQVAVVCASGDQAIQVELDCLDFPSQSRLMNPAPERGMFSSIQCAAQWPEWLPTLTHWAIVLGDQPHLRLQTLHQVLAFATVNHARVCQPSRNGHARHPVLLPRTIFQRLARSKAASLKEFLSSQSRPAALCEVEDPGIDLDIDYPKDYQKAIKLGMHRVSGWGLILL
jgi:molybdenum cofactor cytidylyltransferase